MLLENTGKYKFQNVYYKGGEEWEKFQWVVLELRVILVYYVILGEFQSHWVFFSVFLLWLNFVQYWTNSVTHGRI